MVLYQVGQGSRVHDTAARMYPCMCMSCATVLQPVIPTGSGFRASAYPICQASRSVNSCVTLLVVEAPLALQLCVHSCAPCADRAVLEGQLLYTQVGRFSAPSGRANSLPDTWHRPLDDSTRRVVDDFPVLCWVI